PYSRRDFLISAFAGILSASTFSRSHFTGRTEHASASVSPGQFDIQKITSDVYFAEARSWALANSNAAICVNSSDMLVVDAPCHPSRQSRVPGHRTQSRHFGQQHYKTIDVSTAGATVAGCT